jgi:excisionase family DNA binding protein
VSTPGATFRNYLGSMSLQNDLQKRPALLSRREACERLRVGLSTYKSLVAHKALREVSIGNRGRRIAESELARFIEERMESSEAS